MKKCIFCHRPEEDIDALVESDGQVICDNCVNVCIEELSILTGDKYEQLDIPKPADIKKHLDQYIIGQHNSKKILCAEVYSHMKKQFVSYNISNLLLLGPTGVGKTYMLSILAKYLKVPFATLDCGNVSSAYYRGNDVQQVFIDLLEQAKGDKKLAERGLIYLDEIDKLGMSGPASHMAGGVAVQNELLKLLEGSEVHLSKEASNSTKYFKKDMKFSTDNLLIICGGAFSGLDKIIHKRLGTGQSVGFGRVSSESEAEARDKDIFGATLPQDLYKFGLMKELVGRLSTFAALHSLSVDDLVHIMTVPKDNIVGEFTNLLALDNVKLVFERDALELVAQKALKRKTGARGLRSILRSILSDVLFDIPVNTVYTVTKDLVKEKLA